MVLCDDKTIRKSKDVRILENRKPETASREKLIEFKLTDVDSTRSEEDESISPLVTVDDETEDKIVEYEDDDIDAFTYYPLT